MVGDLAFVVFLGRGSATVLKYLLRVEWSGLFWFQILVLAEAATGVFIMASNASLACISAIVCFITSAY